jgi:hypothetical protein
MSTAGPRVMHAANMMLQAQQWIERTHPRAWGRRGGRDHIWLSPNDEGALRFEVFIGPRVSRSCASAQFFGTVRVIRTETFSSQEAMTTC